MKLRVMIPQTYISHHPDIPFMDIGFLRDIGLPSEITVYSCSKQDQPARTHFTRKIGISFVLNVYDILNKLIERGFMLVHHREQENDLLQSYTLFGDTRNYIDDKKTSLDTRDEVEAMISSVRFTEVVYNETKLSINAQVFRGKEAISGVGRYAGPRG